MKTKIQIIMILISLTFASCDTLPSITLPDNSSSSVIGGITIVYPYDSQHLPLGSMCDVKSESASANHVQSVSLLVNNQVYRQDSFNESYASGNIYQPWTPNAPGEYILQTILFDNSGGQLTSNSVTVYVDEAGEELIEEQPKDEPLDAECVPPIATTIRYANCRSGPGSAYNLVAGLKPDQEFPILGKSASESWWQVQFDDSGINCWIWEDLIEICGETNDVERKNLLEKDTAPEEESESQEPEKPSTEPPKEQPHPTKDPGTGPTTS